MEIPSFSPVRGSSLIRNRPPTPYAQAPGKASSSGFTSSTEFQSCDGEEVLNPLDEEALAALPQVLQENMVELQMSRIGKWQKKIQEAIERNRKGSKKPWVEGTVSQEAIKESSKAARQSEESDYVEGPEPGRAYLRRSRSASFLDRRQPCSMQHGHSQRPRTADETSRTCHEKAELMLQRYHIANALRDKALSSNLPTSEERQYAKVLSKQMRLEPTVRESDTLPKGDQRDKSGLKDRLEYLKVVTLQFLNFRRPEYGRPQRLQKHHQAPTKRNGVVVERASRGVGAEIGTRSYRAHLEGYDV